MDLKRVLNAMRRYWFAVVGVLILTAVAVALVPRNIAADYEAQGSVIILSPSTVEDSSTGEVVGVNPWSRFGSSGEGVAATAVIEVLQSGPFEAQIMDDPAIDEYIVEINPGSNGAIIDITVRATDPDAALEAFDQIVERIIFELGARQEAAGAPEATRLSAEVLTRPEEPTELLGSRSRAMLALGVLGLLASVAVAVGLDALRGGSDRAAKRDAGSGDEAVAGGEVAEGTAVAEGSAATEGSAVTEGTANGTAHGSAAVDESNGDDSTGEESAGDESTGEPGPDRDELAPATGSSPRSGGRGG